MSDSSFSTPYSSYVVDDSPIGVELNSLSASALSITIANVPAGIDRQTTCIEDVDQDEFGDREIVVGGRDGRMQIFKASDSQPLVTLNGFGCIVCIMYKPVPMGPGPQSAAKDSTTKYSSSPRLLILNGEGDLFVLEIDCVEFATLFKSRQFRLDELTAAAERDGRFPFEEQLLPVHFSSSAIIRSHKRFRIPLNVSSAEWSSLTMEAAGASTASSVSSTSESTLPYLILGTLERNVYIYSLWLETDELELTKEGNFATKDREKQREEDRARTVASPSTSLFSSRRSSFNNSVGAMPALQGLAAPMLPASSSTTSSHQSSPNLRSRTMQSTPTSSSPMSSRPSPFPIPAPIKTSTNTNSTNSTRNNSPSLQQQLPPRTGANNTPSLDPRSQAASPAQVRSPTNLPLSLPITSNNGGNRNSAPMLLCKLELKKEIKYLPRALYNVSTICSSAAKLTTLLEESNLSLKQADNSPNSSRTIQVSTSSTMLLQLVSVSNTSLHMVPSPYFQRGAKHREALSHVSSATGLVQGRGNSAGTSTSNLQSKHSASAINLTQLSQGSKDGPAASPMPVQKVQGHMRGQLSVGLSASVSSSAQNSRKNSGAANPPSLMSSRLDASNVSNSAAGQSPHLGSQPSSSPRISGTDNRTVPSLSLVSSSPRFSFLPSTGTAGNSLYATSVSASPALYALTQPAGGIPAFSLSATTPTSGSSDSLGESSAPATSVQWVAAATSGSPVSLSVSPVLLILSLDESVLVVDMVHLWALVLLLPRPNAFHKGRKGKHGGVAANFSSASLASNATVSPPVVNYSSTAALTSRVFTSPRSEGQSMPSAGSSTILHAFAGSNGASIAPPPLQRTISAPGIAGIAENDNLSIPAKSSNLPHSHSGNSTPTLRAAVVRRQPSGINLAALSESDQVARNDVGSPQPSPFKLNSNASTNTLMSAASNCATPSGSMTPSSNSIANSRNVSSAALPTLGNSSQQSGISQSSGQSVTAWETVRAHVRGNVVVKRETMGQSASVNVCADSGVIAVLDALGHFSIQSLASQLNEATLARSPQDLKANDAWYHLAFQLPGQFLGLSSLPTPAASNTSLCLDDSFPSIDSCIDDSEEETLVACSLDGWIYLIPTLPMILPPMPNASSGVVEAQSTAVRALPSRHPLTLTRLHFPSRILSFRCGLYSFSPGSIPTPCIILFTFNNEMILLPDILAHSGTAEWRHEWSWKKRSDSVSVPISRNASDENINRDGEGQDVSADDNMNPSVIYELTAQSYRRTILGTWLEMDGLAKDIATDASATEDVTSESLVQWTTPSHASAAVISSELSSSQFASHARELRSADLKLLNEYRAQLRRQLGFTEEEEETSLLSQSQLQSLDDGTDEVELQQGDVSGRSSPDSRNTSPIVVGRKELAGTSPVVSSFSQHPSHSSPLFAPFKLANNHFAVSNPPSLSLSSSSRAEGEPAPSTNNAIGEDSKSSFWRRSLRRS